MLSQMAEEATEEGDKAIEGAALDSHKGIGAYHVHLKVKRILMLRGDYGVIPDGVENDVGDRFH